MGLVLRTNHTNLPDGATVSNKLLTVEQIDNNFIFLQNNSGAINIVTKIELDTLISTNSLKKGQYYRIQGVDSSINTYDYNLYGGTDIIVLAIDNNKISNSGIGQFFNPKYIRNDQSTLKLEEGYGIWDPYNTYDILVVSDAYNSFIRNEQITGFPNGSVGQIIGDIHSNKFIISSGDWTTEESFTGNESGAVAEIRRRRDGLSVTVKTYSVGDVVYWGGRAWINTSGNVGEPSKYSPAFEFSYSGTSSKNYDDWNPIGYTNSTYYNEVWDDIIYDYLNDTIIERKDKSNNIVRTSKNNNDSLFDNNSYLSPIKAFQWGNEYNYYVDSHGVGNNLVEDSYCCNINFMGVNFIYNTFINQSILDMNQNYSSIMYINSSLIGNVFNNSYYSSNFLSGNFYNNELFNGDIVNNAILGYIVSNIIDNSSIFNNIIYDGGISINTLKNDSTIKNNLLSSSSIYENTLNTGSNIIDNILKNNNSIQYNNLSEISYISNITSLYNSNNNIIEYNNLNSGSYIQSIEFFACSNNIIEYNNLNSGSSIYNIYYDSGNNNFIEYNNLTSKSYISDIYFRTNSNSNYINSNSLHNYSYIDNIAYNTNYSNCYGNLIQYNFLSSGSYVYHIVYESVINNSDITYHASNERSSITNIIYR
jgi:hypothetical protein